MSIAIALYFVRLWLRNLWYKVFDFSILLIMMNVYNITLCNNNFIFFIFFGDFAFDNLTKIYFYFK